MSERPRPGRYFVYVVRCSDGTYYTGSTRDISKRIQRHNAGDGAKYLRGKGPVELVYARECRQRIDALRDERNLKKLTRRQKEALIGLKGQPLRPSSFRSMPSAGFLSMRIELLMGGHAIEEEVVRRRFHKGIWNFFRRYRTVADSWMLFDNSGNVPQPIAEERSGELKVFDQELYDKIVKLAEGK